MLKTVGNKILGQEPHYEFPRIVVFIWVVMAILLLIKFLQSN